MKIKMTKHFHNKNLTFLEVYKQADDMMGGIDSTSLYLTDEQLRQIIEWVKKNKPELIK